MISDNNGGLPRYCHPFHGGWDVARMALNIPESKILFVCPASCARIISLNALNYGYKDRIYVLSITEEDIVAGDYEEKTVQAALEVLATEEVRPRALIIYVSCIDAMLGNDHAFQTKRIMERYPDVNCFVLRMCPITRYSSDLPLVALQYDMYSALPEATVPKEKIVAFIGSNLPLSDDNELVRIIKENGYTPLHIGQSSSYDDFLKVRASALNICYMPFAKKACDMLKARYGTDYVPIALKHDTDYIDSAITMLCEKLSVPLPDLKKLREETLKELSEAAAICDKEVIIDTTATLFPDELRRLLDTAGFRTGRIYKDSAGAMEPDVDSGHITMPGKREYDTVDHDKISIGLVSGCFEKAGKQVPLFYDNGHWGYDELRFIARTIKERLSAGTDKEEI